MLPRSSSLCISRVLPRISPIAVWLLVRQPVSERTLRSCLAMTPRVYWANRGSGRRRAIRIRKRSLRSRRSPGHRGRRRGWCCWSRASSLYVALQAQELALLHSDLLFVAVTHNKIAHLKILSSIQKCGLVKKTIKPPRLAVFWSFSMCCDYFFWV